MNSKRIFLFSSLGLLASFFNAQAITLTQTPLGITEGGRPLIMLNMERDHKLYYEAYNDATDLNGDFKLDIHYDPAINYYGYFDSHKCYSYASGKFTPGLKTLNKQCGSTAPWSGDFLNYLTTSRMDALRRVLYGGRRSTDSATATVLERAYIPQDAHSWGKEYTSTEVDGYDISLYSPLDQPALGTRHIFANTTLLCPSGNSDPGCNSNSGLPLLRVLNDTAYRVWEWLSIERPVAGVECATGNNVRANCAKGTSSSSWSIVPSILFSGLTQKTYTTVSKSDATKTSRYKGSNIDVGSNGFADSKSEFDDLVSNYGTANRQCGSGSAANINGTGNPFKSGSICSDDEYLTLFEGTLTIPAGQGGSYKFAVDGDDAVDVSIDGFAVAQWYGGHGSNNGDSSLNSHSGTVTLTAGAHSIKFRHQEFDGGDSYYLYWQKTTPSSSINDYVVRVDACVSGLEEEECRGYPNNKPTVYKPAGILQEYGENGRMAFGLITGSYDKNVSGGVLRKNISSFTDEITAANGRFTTINGIIKTIDTLKIVGFGSDYTYNQNCGVPEVNGPLENNRCRMWGNPLAESMYEGLRYFAGESGPTSAFTYSGSTDDSSLGLPLPTWQNPYRTTTGGYPSCSKPSQLVISDVTPNFDTDQVPGNFAYTKPSTASSFTGGLSGLNVTTLGQTIWDAEYGSSKSVFIGQSGNTYDGAPTPKTVSSFGNIRGLSPEEPSQQGGYYAASISLYSKTNDVNSGASGNQKIDTFSVALGSHLPQIKFPINGKVVTLVPFAKTVGGCGSFSSSSGSYQPTNTIVDFYIDTIANTDSNNANSAVNNGRPYIKFRINFEDSEYGSDHDMDAIAEYELTAKSNNTVDIRVSSNYAAGGCIQHMGYVISGTTANGLYLEIRDQDTSSSSDVDYYLDTPNVSGALPVDTTRNFVPGSDSSAEFIAHDPLWYAAKWGGFIDSNQNNILDDNGTFKEWDNRDGADGIPDSYFLVTNAGDLKDQLDKAFTEILQRDGSAAAAATNSSTLQTQSRVYQAKFNSAEWSGQLLAFKISLDGTLSKTSEWDASKKINELDPATGRVIITKGATDGVAFAYGNLTGPTTTTGTQQNLIDTDASGVKDNCGVERIAYLRGDDANEGPGGNFTCASGTATSLFRERLNTKLGDIVNSSPIYVGPPNAGYSETEAPGYSAFRLNKASRSPVIYVGANDGMLHGFNAPLGNEVLGYVPSPVFLNLSKLTDQAYNVNHRYFVDSSPMIGDIDLTPTSSSHDWRSVLIGGLGAGGRGFYALDITEPANFSEGNAANILLWEFDDSDLGNTFNNPSINPNTGMAKQIVKLKVGSTEKWAAILGNGYNSSNGKSVLYVIFINDGIDGSWTAGDFVKLVADVPASATDQNNGLSTPLPVDSDNDGFVDTVYAGDLKGNLWKFLIGANPQDSAVTSNTSTWKVAFSTSACATTAPSTCVPFFKAVNNSNQAQPIYWPPEVRKHPNGGQLVFAGTGKLIDTNDNTNTEKQSFYGLWDRNDGTAIRTRSQDLLQQSLSSTACANPLTTGVACTLTQGANVFRIPTANQINWRDPAVTPIVDANCASPCTATHMGWYIDMLDSGERATGVAKYLNKVIVFNTYIPSGSVCSDPTGFIMALDYLTGGLTSNRKVFDTNGDNQFTSQDVATGGMKVGAVIGGTTFIKTSGISAATNTSNTNSSTPTVTLTAGTDITISSTSTGGLERGIFNRGVGVKGRLSWIEITPD